jgi:RND family efflux transporter MFP subunit
MSDPALPTMDTIFNGVCVLVATAFALTLVPGFRRPERSLLARRDQGTALLVFTILALIEEATVSHAGFDGIVTARNTDIGAYIPAGSGSQLFRMAATSRLRVYVTVPQALSALIRAGEQAELTVDQFPGRKFPAHVVSTAGAISSDAKRLLTELEVPNPTGELSSGSYVQITLDIPIDDRGVIISAETLLLPSGQPAVAVVHANGKVAIQSVTVIHDLGAKLQVSGDVSESNQLIRNPSPDLASGAAVTLVKPPQK